MRIRVFLVKAVHLELASNLTTAAFFATLQRFISQQGKPTTIWSDHGTNFVGACQEIKELYAHLKKSSFSIIYKVPGQQTERLDSY